MKADQQEQAEIPGQVLILRLHIILQQRITHLNLQGRAGQQVPLEIQLLLLILQRLIVPQLHLILQKLQVRVDQPVHLGILQLHLTLQKQQQKVGIHQHLKIQVPHLILVQQQHIRRFFLRQEAQQQRIIHQSLPRLHLILAQPPRIIQAGLQQFLHQSLQLQHLIRVETLLSLGQLQLLILQTQYIIRLPLQQQRLTLQL